MRKVVSREYKVMLDPGGFSDRGAAVETLRVGLGALAGAIGQIVVKGRLVEGLDRTIVFLDTPEDDLRRAGYLLRRRMGGGKAEYTLKCRSEDRYFAAGADLRAVAGFEGIEKLEEDIAPPFRCRFSHSNTVIPPKKTDLRAGALPTSLGEVAAFFPVLETLRSEGRTLPADSPIGVVNGIVAFERLLTGARVLFDGDHEDGGGGKAPIALILWSDGEGGRPLVAELSFRLEDEKERYPRALAGAARSFFEGIQRLDLARPAAATKTEFVYRDTDGD